MAQPSSPEGPAAKRARGGGPPRRLEPKTSEAKRDPTAQEGEHDQQPLSEAELRQFQEEGFVILRGFIPASNVAAARSAADKLTQQLAEKLVAEGKVPAHGFESEPLETRFARLYEHNPQDTPLLLRKELHLPEMFEVFGCPKLLAAAHQIVQGEELRIFPNYTMRPKLPNFGPHDVVWHQDAGLLPDGSPNRSPIAERQADFGLNAMVNCWLPLVPATVRTGCMKFVPKTHKLGVQPHVVAGLYRDQGKEENATTKEAAVPSSPPPGSASVPAGTYSTQIDPAVVALHTEGTIDAACEPGDVILFSNLLFHRGGFNTSEIVRWSLDWRYQDASRPTHRPQTGHVLRVRSGQGRVVARTGEEWARLSLT